GTLSKGDDILAAEEIGADFAYIGSRFISADVSGAYEKYKDMVIDSDIADIIYTDAISGINGNYLITSIEQAGMDPKNLSTPEKVNFDKTNQSRAKAWKDIWGAGQGVEMIEGRESMSEAVAKLRLEYEHAKQHVSLT